MLLYDLDVDRLGKLRVAEHFTVADSVCEPTPAYEHRVDFGVRHSSSG
jgi:hypothetical protein